MGAHSDVNTYLEMKAFLLIGVVILTTITTMSAQEVSRPGALVETKDGRIFLVRTSSAANSEKEEELNWESSSMKEKKKKKKKKKTIKKKKKSAKKSYDRVL